MSDAIERIQLIVNPVAGAGRARRVLPLVLAELRRRGLEATVSVTDARGEAARTASVCDADAVVVVGGDGSLNEVVKGLLERPEPPPFGLIPFGTGNGAARAFDLPRRLEQAIEALVSGARRAVDVAEVDRDGVRVGAFLLWLGAGLDGAFIHALARRRVGPMGTRVALWMPGLLRAASRYRFATLVLEIDGGPRLECAQVIVANVGTSTVPRFDVAPGADPCDGRLDILTMTRRSWAGWLRALMATFLGRIESLPGVRLRQGTSVRIESPSGAVPVQVDGEAAGFTPVRVRLRPRALTLLLPRRKGS